MSYSLKFHEKVTDSSKVGVNTELGANTIC